MHPPAATAACAWHAVRRVAPAHPAVLPLAGALSRGDASVFMRFPDPSYREKIWDHCAGVIILQVGAGGAEPAAQVGPGA